ncbi:MAG: hypothetical protein ABI405_12250 [Parafilimonas sp.]
MSDRINILNELRGFGASVLINTDNRNYFYVPDDYFDNLAENVLTHIFIASLPSVNPYSIQAEYFENLPDIVLEKIQFEQSISFQNINEKKLYSIPDGYFNDLADNILNKIKSSSSNSIQSELEEIAPFLSTLSKTNVYSVPENYFDQLNPLPPISDKQPPAQIISLGRKSHTWLNFAVAACIAAVLFGGGYLYFFNNPKNDTVSSLAKMDVQKAISVLSDDEIANYLKDNNNIAVYTNSGNDDEQIKNIDIQNLLNNVSDEEIQDYLNENPESPEKGGGI